MRPPFDPAQVRHQAAPGRAMPADSQNPANSPRGPKLLDRVRMAARALHLARSTERAYVSWIRQYILFHGKRHPSSLREPAVTEFLTSLAVERNVAAST